MKKAIGDNMIPKEWGFEKGLRLVKKAEFDGIELWLGDGASGASEREGG